MSPARTYLKEADVKAEVKKILNQHEWYWWMPPANGYGKPNVDFNALRDGVFLAIETKFGTNRCTPLQMGFLSSISAESGMGFVVTEKTIEDFRTWCEKFDEAAQLAAKKEPVPPSVGGAMLNAIAVLTEPFVLQPTPAPDAVR